MIASAAASTTESGWTDLRRYIEFFGTEDNEGNEDRKTENNRTISRSCRPHAAHQMHDSVCRASSKPLHVRSLSFVAFVSFCSRFDCT